jgi:hypothetical protein
MEDAEFPEKKIYFNTFERTAARGQRAAESRSAG